MAQSEFLKHQDEVHERMLQYLRDHKEVTELKPLVEWMLNDNMQYATRECSRSDIHLLSEYISDNFPEALHSPEAEVFSEMEGHAMNLLTMRY